jgi:hypothetical protein
MMQLRMTADSPGWVQLRQQWLQLRPALCSCAKALNGFILNEM